LATSATGTHHCPTACGVRCGLHRCPRGRRSRLDRLAGVGVRSRRRWIQASPGRPAM